VQTKIPLYVSILTVFMTAMLLITGALSWVNYTRMERAAMSSAESLFNNVRDRVIDHQTSLFSPLMTAVALYGDDPLLAKGDVDSLTDPFLTLMEMHPQIYGIFAGFETGEFFEVYSFDGEAEGEAVGAPPNARFAIRSIGPVTDGPRPESWIYLDEFRIEISHTEKQVTYDPRERPWYMRARAAPGETVRTPPYAFAASESVGVTFAKGFYGYKSGVVAADVTLVRLSQLLREFKTTPQRTIFTFDNTQRLTAHGTPARVMKSQDSAGGATMVQANIADLGNPVADAMLQRFQESGTYAIAPLEIDGVVYLTTVTELPDDMGGAEYLAFAVPRGEFMGSVLEFGRQSLFWAAVIILLSAPFIVWVSRRISRPLGELALEAEHIRRFELDQPVSVRSRIREIHELTESVGSMKNALNQVSKFVPKALVQDLIKSQASLDVGGERRLLSFLFTDVRDFTPLSEAMPPEKLMVQMSEYFQVLVKIILDHGGTVDKYVGDAIFSYWNAPREQEDHFVRSCEAALACRIASNALNAVWREQGREVWYTRFGVHMGDAVVGNVGSSDRIDYTVIGNAVNIASRLEGLNKVYGTQVVASGPVWELTKDRFLYRRLDRVMPKGALYPIDIYELVGTFEGPDAFRVIGAQKRLCADWEETYKTYLSHDWSRALDAFEAFAMRHPEDKVARIYLERIIVFLVEPPPPDWDGVTRFEQK